METRWGTSYNAYLIAGEKTALIDGVKEPFQDEWFGNIGELCPVEKIDYLIVNHTEPDHSGSLPTLLERNPNVKILCAAPAVPFLTNVLNREADIQGIKDNFELDLGGTKLIFKLTPYMHWPDTMMEFAVEDGVLFSCDGFAAHVTPEGVFEDELPGGVDLDFEVEYYYDAIMRPFSGYIRRNLPKLDDFAIRLLATSHGPVIRREPRKYIDQYKDWTAERVAQDVAVCYASNYGNTGALAAQIEKELSQAGLSVRLADITSLSEGEARDLIESSRAVLIGTPTFNGDAVKPVWDFVALFSTVYSIGKKAAVFGSYGWGGEGIKLVAERLAGLKLKVMENRFRARLVPSDEEAQALPYWAREIAAFVGGK
jgi:flavorubredoxin